MIMRLRFAFCVALMLIALVGPARASSPPAAAGSAQRLVLRFAPGVRYTRAETLTHHVTYDLNPTLRKLTGSKSNPVTILEVRQRTLQELDATGAVKISETNTRHYVDSKDKSVVTRNSDYSGTLKPDGSRAPSPGFLGDAGDGALDQLPAGPIAVGQTWSFSRNFKVDRSLGQGVMTYTDKLERLETRGGKTYAIIGVTGAGRADIASDLRGRGFHTTDLNLTGTGEFDVTDGMPGAQHYTAHGEWRTHVLFSKIGVIFDDTYEAQPWTRASASSTH